MHSTLDFFQRRRRIYHYLRLAKHLLSYVYTVNSYHARICILQHSVWIDFSTWYIEMYFLFYFRIFRCVWMLVEKGIGWWTKILFIFREPDWVALPELKQPRCEIFDFFSSHSLKTIEKYISFWMMKFIIMYFFLHNCVFYHSKLKSKHASLKKYTSWAKLTEQTNIFFSCCEGMRGEKIKYFAPVKLVFEKSFAMIIGFKVPV